MFRVEHRNAGLRAEVSEFAGWMDYSDLDLTPKPFFASDHSEPVVGDSAISSFDIEDRQHQYPPGRESWKHGQHGELACLTRVDITMKEASITFC